MKQKYVWIGFIAVLVLGISAFIGCDDDSHDVVRFVGKAVYSGTSDPFVDIPVKVTDGQNTHCQTTTDAGGQFTLTVRISDIDGAYYLLAGDSTCVPKRVTLGGFGRMEVDLGSIEVEGPSLPIVETKPVSAIAASSATCGGNVVNDGRLTILARGICWSTSEEPMIEEDSHTTNGTGKGEFQTKITGLERNTTYYVRAYATNAKGTAYGNQVTFTTITGKPTVTTADISNITATTAKCGGEVLDNGGFTVTARGICWNTMGNPDINDSKTTNGNGNSTFTSNMTGLTPNTTYYVRAYATNSIGTAYGKEKTLKTGDGRPIVETTTTTATSTKITSGGKITSDEGYSITARGVCYSTTNSTPTIADEHTTSGTGPGSFSSIITNVSTETTYYVRAYATNSIGTGYGEVIIVTTGDGKPYVTTTKPTENGTTIVSGGNVTSDEGFTVTARGICYGTLPHPDLSDTYQHTTNGEGTGFFTSTIDGSTINGKIYIRAYATNAKGTNYGEEYEFIFNQEYNELPTFQFNGKTYKVAPDPHTSNSEYISWTAANAYCENLTYCGYDDWRLPTVEELETMYQNRNSIGGFINSSNYYSYYHSSTSCSGSIRYVITWYSGTRDCNYYLSEEGTNRSYGRVHVRPIRVHQ